MNNKTPKLITRANLVIAFVIAVVLFLLYGNKTMMTDWIKMIGARWLWLPVVIILFVAILYGRHFFRKKS